MRLSQGSRSRYNVPRSSVSNKPKKDSTLFENEELYAAIVQSIADGVAITVNTERVFVNRAFLAIHGLASDSEVVGHPLEQFVVPEDRDAVRERVLARQRGEHPDNIVEYRIQRPDGEVRTLQASVVATTHKGQPAILSVLRDITAVKKAELEIVRLNQELEQKIVDLRNANEELGAFNSMVSHDLRTPLMVIEGVYQRIKKTYAGSFDEKLTEQADIIQANVKRIEQLINDLLAYAKLGKEAVQHGRVSMTALVESIVGEFRALYPDGEVMINPLPHCVGDEHMLNEMFTNLISNAFKFTSKEPTRVIEIGCTQRATDNVFFIKDNGVGFDPAYMDRLFNPFQRLHSQEEFRGTGMGLAIVKKIATLHRGTVCAEGNPGHGATFYVALPRIEEPS
ncbi:MAG TPA: ATP-binding protein [Syntrophorhabdaceae bacterium]|nr:ATP-binding protein [Syntrophorhabdaceae bacterium]